MSAARSPTLRPGPALDPTTTPSPTLITLRALVAARWVLVGIVFGVGCLDWLTRGVDAPIRWYGTSASPIAWLALVAGWVAVNIASRMAITRLARLGTLAAGLHLICDALAITGLLALSGGAANPFTTLYFVPITLATQISPRWTWLLASTCLVCFGGLFLFHSAPMQHGDGAHFAGHLHGMWLAFALSGVLITYFVHRIALALLHQREELYALREAALRDRHLAQLGSLAAGAAHELGTPLATLTLLVDDLGIMEPDERRDAVAQIRAEVARCKTIVASMRGPRLRALALSPGDTESWPLVDLADGEGTDDAGVTWQIDAPTSARVTVPRQALTQILRELIANARNACGANGSIRVHLDVVDEDACIVVADDGVGMEASIVSAALDPFFTTSERAENMGLGLYLADAMARQLGGSLSLESNPGAGTRVTVRFPLHYAVEKP